MSYQSGSFVRESDPKTSPAPIRHPTNSTMTDDIQRILINTKFLLQR